MKMTKEEFDFLNEEIRAHGPGQISKETLEDMTEILNSELDDLIDDLNQ